MDYKLAKRRFDSISKKRKDDPRTFSFEEFKNFYGPDKPVKPRCCHYCDLNESEIASLIEDRLIVTKRLVTRGRTMEVDRKNPEGPYSIDNVVLCCYWCNNAKTDEFTYEEFKAIAKSFHEVWRTRMSASSKRKSA